MLLTDRAKLHLAAARTRKEILKHLDSLNSREAHLLVVAVSNAIQTVTWRQDADEVSSLVAKGLLSVVPDNSKMFHKPYTVPRFVWEHITKAEVMAKMKALDKDAKSEKAARGAGSLTLLAQRSRRGCLETPVTRWAFSQKATSLNGSDICFSCSPDSQDRK